MTTPSRRSPRCRRGGACWSPRPRAPGSSTRTDRSDCWAPTRRRRGRPAACSRPSRAGRQLTAVDPVGTVRWSLAAQRPVSNPTWSPSGIRVAYTSGNSLRVVAGDGTGDRLLVGRVASVAPAWRPLSEPVPAGQVAIGPRTNVLAYVDRRGRVTVRDVDTGGVLWRTHRYGASDPGARVVGGPQAPSGPHRLGRRLPRRPRPSDPKGDLADARREHVAGQQANRVHPAGQARPQRRADHRPQRQRPAAARPHQAGSNHGSDLVARRQVAAGGAARRRSVALHPSLAAASGSRPSPTSPASSPPAPPASRRSRGSAAGAAPADARGRSTQDSWRDTTGNQEVTLSWETERGDEFRHS